MKTKVTEMKDYSKPYTRVYSVELQNPITTTQYGSTNDDAQMGWGDAPEERPSRNIWED